MMIKKKRKKEDMGLIDCLLILLPKCQQNQKVEIEVKVVVQMFVVVIEVVAGAELFEIELVAEVEIEVAAGVEMFEAEAEVVVEFVVVVAAVDKLVVEIEVLVETKTGLAEVVGLELKLHSREINQLEKNLGNYVFDY